jgi:hypothetical protein
VADYGDTRPLEPVGRETQVRLVPAGR